MPKQAASPHFDANALLVAVHQQEVGLRISTNNKDGFRRLVYAQMRKHPHLRAHIYADPVAPNAFYLLKSRLPTVEELAEEEEQDDAA